jgi:O-antigen ligase
VFGLLAIAAVLLWMRERGRMAWLLVALGALLLAGLVLSRSRGPLGGAILVIAAALVARRTLVARPWVPLAVGAVVAVAFSGVLVSRLLELRDPGGTHAGRAEYWPKAWEDFRSAPVFGIGFGRYNDERTADGWIVRNDDKTAHNSYLHWMAEGGVVGLAVMAAFWALVFRETWRLPDGFWRDAGLSGIVFQALISVTEHYLGGGIALLHLSLFLGVAHAGAKSEEEGSPLAPGGACPPERPPGGPA